MTEHPKQDNTKYPYAAVGYPPPQSHPPASNPYPPPSSSYFRPPPPPQPNPAYYAADAGQSTWTTWRRFIFSMVTVFVIFGAIMLVLWLILWPEFPKFSVTAVAVPSLNFTFSNQLKADWDVTFTAYNHNKRMAIRYDDVRAAVWYRREILAVTTLSPFHQEMRNKTTLTVHFSSDSYVPDYAFEKLKSDRRAGIVGFHFGLSAAVQFRSGAWKTRWRELGVRCYDVKIKFGSGSATSGSLKSSPTHCAVYW